MKQQQHGTARFLRLLNPGSCWVADGSMSEFLPVWTRTSSFLLSLVRRYTEDLWKHPWVEMENDWAEQA